MCARSSSPSSLAVVPPLAMAFLTAFQPMRSAEPAGQPAAGPRLTDAGLLQMLAPSPPGLEEAVRLRDRGEEGAALAALAAFLRAREEPADFGDRGGREPGFDRWPAERILRHEVVVAGIHHTFGPEIDWGFNPTTAPGSGYDRDHEWTWQLNRHNE